ncbi:MAG: hypothetical protein J6X43_01740 [Bacteroidales bacterium]|nr:hypothetical protein [Bacteroidales bacterium]
MKKRWKDNAADKIRTTLEFLENETDYTSKVLEEKTMAFIAKNEFNVGQICNCLRLAVVGACMGAHLFDIFEMIGKEETLKRVRNHFGRGIRNFPSSSTKGENLFNDLNVKM